VKFAFAPGDALDDEAGIFVNEYTHPISPLQISVYGLQRVTGLARSGMQGHFLVVFWMAFLVAFLAVLLAMGLTVFLTTGLTIVRALGL
jgi:hypothetical protein